MLELHVLFVNPKYDKDLTWMKEEVFLCLKTKYWFEKHFFFLLIESTTFLIILGFNLLLHKTNIFNYLKHEDQ